MAISADGVLATLSTLNNRDHGRLICVGAQRCRAFCADDRQAKRNSAHDKKCGSYSFSPLVPWKVRSIKALLIELNR